MAQNPLFKAELFDHRQRYNPDVNPYSSYESRVPDRATFDKEIEQNFDLTFWEVLSVGKND